MEPIGARLLASGRIEAAQLEWALERQRAVGGYVGQHLIDAGFITRSEFYAALAEHWELTPRDLVAHPPAPELLAELDPETTVELGWVACELTAGGVVVATAVRPAEELVAEVEEQFPGRSITFVACTRRDLDGVALTVRRDFRPVAEDARRPGGVRVRPVHYVLVALLGVLALACGILLPLGVVAAAVLVTSFVFLAGAAVQAVSGLSALAPPPEVRRRPVHSDDAQLPVYTVLMQVAGGEPAVRAALEALARHDYPSARLDAVLLVSDDDQATLDGVRRVGPPEWVRVARVPAAERDEPILALDHGLTLARGRYVVAYALDEVPAADQLRQAVAAFEADLAAGLAGGGDQSPAPVVGLRAARRADGDGRSHFSRMTEVDEALDLGRLSGDRGRADEVTSVHFNMRLLRRHGGFALATDGDLGDGPRVEHLDSISVRAEDPGLVRWTDARARANVRAMRGAFSGGLPAPEVARRLLTPAMFLAYPVTIVGALLAAVRGEGEHSRLAERVAWLGIGEAAIVLGMAVLVAAVSLFDQRGWRAAFDALALPAHWALHSVATWVALLAVLTPSRRSGDRA